MLLQARADPNECGYEKVLSGEAVSPEGGQQVLRVTPLWQAVEDACGCSPSSSQGRDRRAIVLLLLLYGARPDSIGKIEYFSVPQDGYDAELDGPVDSDGNVNTSDSETTPLEAARKWNTAVPDPKCTICGVSALVGRRGRYVAIADVVAGICII